MKIIVIDALTLDSVLNLSLWVMVNQEKSVSACPIPNQS